jgi:hypothetical protein
LTKRWRLHEAWCSRRLTCKMHTTYDASSVWLAARIRDAARGILIIIIKGANTKSASLEREGCLAAAGSSSSPVAAAVHRRPRSWRVFLCCCVKSRGIYVRYLQVDIEYTHNLAEMDPPPKQTDQQRTSSGARDRRPCCMTSRTCELAVMGTSSIKDKQPTLQSPSEPPVSEHFPNLKSSAVLTLIRLLNCKYFTSPPYNPPYPGRCAELAT